MAGVRLEAKVHIVTGAVSSAQNIVKCANRTGLNVADIVLQPLASTRGGALARTRRSWASASSTSAAAPPTSPSSPAARIVHTAVIALGGNHLTNDIAVGLRTPAHEAERIKQRYGCAMASMVDKDETIEVPCVGGAPAARARRGRSSAEIIEPRVEEIFPLVHREIAEVRLRGPARQRAWSSPAAPRCSPGMPELAEEVLGLPVRRGHAAGIGGLVDVVKSPMYATGVGLVRLRRRGTSDRRMFTDPRRERLPQGQGSDAGVAGEIF